MKKLFIPAIIVIALSQNVFAGNGLTDPVQIESLSVIGVPIGGHQAGNMEIKILGGFDLPPGVSCDSNYITTKKSVDNDRAMLSLLRDAQTSNQTVQLWISDSPAYRAFRGRCSLFAVSVLTQ